MTRFLLVRHGQSEWNAQGRWQGQADPHLSDHGREEARLAAAALRGFEGIVFSSPLLRARETAEIISSEVSDGSVFLEPDLREIDVGEFSGLTNDEIAERLPDAWHALREGRLDGFPGGELREHFLQRLLDSLQRIASHHAGANVLAVAHGGAIAAIERYLGVHPGHGVGNLVGRWFVLENGEVRTDGDRIAFADQPS